MVQDKKLQLKFVYSIPFFFGSNSRIIKSKQSSFYSSPCLMFLVCFVSKLRTVRAMKSHENLTV